MLQFLDRSVPAQTWERDHRADRNVPQQISLQRSQLPLVAVLPRFSARGEPPGLAKKLVLTSDWTGCLLVGPTINAHEMQQNTTNKPKNECDNMSVQWMGLHWQTGRRTLWRHCVPFASSRDRRQ